MPLNNSGHNLIDQRRLTKTQGEHVSLYAVVSCSCRGVNGEHANPTCRVCGGSGRAYHARKRVKGIIAGISAQDKALLSAGIAMPGDLTFSPEVGTHTAIHDYDMVRLDYPQPYEGDVVERGKDRLAYLPHTITDVEQHDPFSGHVRRYEQGADFAIDGQTIAWFAGHGPAYGTAYSVKYHAIFDWVVYPGVTLQRRTRGTYLGQRVLLRKRHLAGIPVHILPEAFFLAGASAGVANVAGSTAPILPSAGASTGHAHTAATLANARMLLATAVGKATPAGVVLLLRRLASSAAGAASASASVTLDTGGASLDGYATGFDWPPTYTS